MLHIMTQRVSNLLLEKIKWNLFDLITALFSLLYMPCDMSNPAAILTKELNASYKSTKSGARSSTMTLTYRLWAVLNTLLLAAASNVA